VTLCGKGLKAMPTSGGTDEEPFTKAEARRRVSIILAKGSVVIWQHCRKEADKDHLTDFAITQSLQYGSIYEEAEYEGGHWRYRFHRHSICVVIQFEDTQKLSVVTCWKGKSR
jgi:hypothetical protein